MKNKSLVSKHTAFLEDSEKKAFDKDHRATINYNMACYDEAVARGKQQFANLELARRRAAVKKHTIVEHLEDYLKNFEHQFKSRGGKVIWAVDAEQARKAILNIFEEHYVKLVVKSKSMVSEEIDLCSFLEKNGIDCLETDLGEYIVQISDDKPYHIVTPAMHLSRGDVAAIFHERFGLSKDASPEEITRFVREELRDKFVNAHAGITGANFLVAGSGSVAVTENEGNALLSMSYPKIHIVIAGIDKLIASVSDLELFWPLLASHGTGQNITAYNSLINGPRQEGESDGPEQMYVILLDNGRSQLLGATPQRRAFSCIRCGACLNACPVYHNIGGHTYGHVYSGPIGAVISPFMSGQLQDYIHLSYASSLCGKCTEVCPVGIDLHNQLLHNRRLAVKKGFPTRGERMGMKAYKFMMKKSSRLERFSPRTKNFAARYLFKKPWGPRRVLPRVVESFRKRN